MTSDAATVTQDEDDQFRITSTVEILAELRNAMAQRSLLTIHYGSARECAITTVLHINSAAKTLILDAKTCWPHTR